MSFHAVVVRECVILVTKGKVSIPKLTPCHVQSERKNLGRVKSPLIAPPTKQPPSQN